MQIDKNYSTTNNTSEIKKDFDKEHKTIEKIFRISLEESDKFLYLEFFHAQLLSTDTDIKFRITQLDDIMLAILENEEKV
jgi:hypothetical protein